MDKLERIEEAVLSISEEVKILTINSATQNEQLGFYNDLLKDHIKRTNILEELLENSKKDTDTRLRTIETKFNYVDGVFKFFGASTVLIGLITGIMKIFHLL